MPPSYRNRSRYRKNATPVDRWLSCVLALRLRQIEQQFESYSEFADKSGLSRGTLLNLRYGRGNPTFKTLSALAEAYQVSVWSLLALPDDLVKEGFESYGLKYDGLEEMLDKVDKVADDEPPR